MVTFLNQVSSGITFLGDDKKPAVKEDQDARSPSVERRELAVIGATGKTIEASDNIPAEIANKVSQTLSTTVNNYTQEATDVDMAVEELQDQANKGADLMSITDYFDNSFHAMDNPYFTRAENLASIKYQMVVEKITDAIQVRTADTTAGSVINWLDRYLLRQLPIGAFEDFTRKRKTVSEEFARAISGDMPIKDFETFLDSRVDEYLEQGFFFGENPEALKDLLATIEKFGTDDGLDDALIGAVDLLPFVGLATQGVSKTAKVAKNINQARRISRTLNRISRSPTPATRAGAINGPEAATEVAENIARVSDEPENLANMGPSLTDAVGDNAPVRPLGAAASFNHTAQQLTDETFAYLRRAVGDIYDDDLVTNYLATRVASLSESLNRGVIDIKLDTDTEKLTVLLGHPRTGRAMTRDAAERHAEDFPEATVVAISEDAGAYAIQVDEVIKMDDFIKTDKYAELQHVEGVTSKIFRKIFQRLPTSGSHLIDNADATNLAYRSESAAVRLNQLNAPMIKKINSMSARELDDVGDILTRLQSRDEASHRNWYTEDEFTDRWKADHQGRAPSQKVLDGYKALVDLSDHTYHVRAVSMIRRLHNNNFRRITVNVGGEEKFLAGKRKDSLPSDVTEFIDAETGVRFTRAEYDGPMANVFELDMDIGGITHVVDTRTIKPLEPEDVLGYNAGGSRINPEASDFVVFLDADGKPLKVALSASSSKSAALAREQMNNIYSAMKTGNLTNAIVRSNNKWNPELQTVEDFDAFLSDNGLRLDTNDIQIATKTRDESVFSTGDDAIVPNGTSYTEFSMFANRRNNRPLTHFGGTVTANDNPINSILNQTNTESRRLAFANYNDAIQVSLGKKIKEIADPNSSDVDYRKYYRNAEQYLGDPKKVSDPLVRKIFERKKITDLRLGAEGFGDAFANRMSQDMSNIIYDTAGIKFNAGNPAHFLTNYGFKTTFLLDPFQFLLQSAHSINIVGMAGLDDGIKGAVMGKFLLQSLKIDGRELDLMVNRMATQFGYTADEMKEIRQLFIDSARYEIDPTNLVEGYIDSSNSVSRGRSKRSRVVGNSVGKVWEKTMNSGMFFFNKGEQISRVTGFGAAVRKWKKENPDLSILSPEGRSWVTNKEQAYTLNMTNMSRADIQQGILRVPTQFYSYMLRSFEGVFIGKDLTPFERRRLATMIGPFYGMTGIGATSLTSSTVDAFNAYLPEGLQIEEGSDRYRLIKNGPIDAIFAWADDTLLGDAAPEVSIASRVSLGDGVVDTFRNYRDANVVEIIGGAGGGKAGDTLVDFTQVLGAITRGDDILLTERTVELFRNLKFIDNAAKAYGVFKHGIYTSKTGARVDANFTNMDALFAALGIPLEEVQQVYDSNSLYYNTNRTYNQISKEIGPRIDLFWDKVNEGDAERAKEILDSIHLSVSRINGLPDELRDRLREQVMNGFKSKTTWERVKQLRRMGLETEAEQLKEITR